MRTASDASVRNVEILDISHMDDVFMFGRDTGNLSLLFAQMQAILEIQSDTKSKQSCNITVTT